MKRPTGCPRHLFTAVATSGREDGGFRTVAHSPELSSLVDAIESLVDGYRVLDADTPACRQLLPVPGRRQIYAFTVFTPTGATPDGRPGNYWAETLIVPADWLAAGGWDTAAACEGLEWQGPRDVAELDDKLPAVVLPTPRPGRLERLASLVEAVPEERLFALVLALVQQSQGLRKLRLLEAPAAPPERLERVVELLPLLVPPALRTYRDDDRRRCLSWRTRSPLGAMAPAADLTGFPALAADDLEREGAGSLVFDLAGRLPPPVLRDRFGERYARWLHRKLTRADWGDLEALYAGDVSGPAAAWFADFRRGDAGEDSAARATAGEEGVPVFAARQAAWKARDAAEGAAWALLESHRRQLEANLAELRQELDEAAQKASQQWAQVLQSQRDDFDVRGNRLAADARSAGRGLEARVTRLEQEVRRLRAQAGEAGPVADSPPGGFAQQVDTLRSRWTRGLQRRDAAALIPKLAIAALVVVAIVWGATSAVRSFTARSADRETVAPDTVTQASETLREQRRETLLQQLRDRDTALLLVRLAAADEGYRSRADAVLLALTLGRRAPLPDAVGKALLQQALEVTVDGQWGAGSSQALKDNLPVDCQPCATAATEVGGALAWNGPEASCFLILHLKLEDPPCPGSSPWRRGRAWTETEAGEALRLIRAALAKSADQELTGRIAELEPIRNPELSREVAKPSLRQAEMLFDLAYAWVAEDPRAEAPEKIPARRLDDLGALLNRLAPAAPVDAAATPGGAG